jgi:hypothetical protein
MDRGQKRGPRRQVGELAIVRHCEVQCPGGMELLFVSAQVRPADLAAVHPRRPGAAPVHRPTDATEDDARR